MRTKLPIIFFIPLFLLVSCIKDEPLNREADILSFRVADSLYVESVIKDNSVLLLVNDRADIEKIVPYITVSPGAFVSPASGDTIDFSKDQIFKVQSEDGRYEKSYIVSVGSKVNLKYNFDDWTTDAGNENIHSLSDLLWADANSGVKIAASFIGITQFPTDYTTDCVSGGKAALLQTIKGGKIIFVNIPIFAGSLLRGKFEANMLDPLKSLKLGQKFPQGNGKPTFFTGYYKYFPGPIYTDSKGKVVEGKQDQMSMYAAIFKVPKGKKGDEMYLDGHSILTSSDVIARAEWSENNKNIIEAQAINGYKHFSIPFDYKEDFDYNQYNYKLTMVFSSSKDGNLYEGAIGSKLYIDEIEVITSGL